ncbi:hypothetical protein RhiirA4_464958 [Rhizophagus irregularis]|uniref:Crinkler family protein n=1 Tax=Rhizophagus irregularis TaxID=588596 RepID=A0A2I1GR41_9GLOM|nr:hypothetical protein RhiirA4_464958 [Rhizophagus irregularis]
MIVEFNIIVNPKRTKVSKWIVNIEQVTLKDLKEFVFALYQFPELQKDVATLAFSCNDEKYSPKSDLEFQNMLQLFVSKNNLKFTVYIETSLSFSSWTFPKICKLYKLSEDSDPTLSVFPPFTCGCVELNDEKSQNAVQCESALSSKKKNVFGIITDSEKWFFLECSLDNERKPNFKLSKPMVIIYGDEDMEDRVKKVLGHIVWLLGEAQRLDELEDKN